MYVYGYNNWKNMFTCTRRTWNYQLNQFVRVTSKADLHVCIYNSIADFLRKNRKNQSIPDVYDTNSKTNLS
jgi:hypothetical protein